MRRLAGMHRVTAHDDPDRYGIGEAGIVGGSHSVDQDTDLVTPRDGVDDRTWVRGTVLPGQAVELRPVVEAAVNPAQVTRFREAMEGLVDGIATGEVEEIRKRPDSTGQATASSVEDDRFEAGGRSGHVRNLYRNFGQKGECAERAGLGGRRFARRPTRWHPGYRS